MKFLSIAIIITMVAIIIYNVVAIVKKVKIRKQQKLNAEKCNENAISNNDIKSDKEV